jgi:serine-type D-Ala-D-Ala carboxypeptidase (penicillin-binding protein 5/6)
LQNYNLFPMEKTLSLMNAPERASDYADIKIWAGSSVVIDVDSGTILEYYNGRKQTQIASLTKLMTAVLVMENVKNLEEEVTITSEARNVVGTVVGCPNSTSSYCVGPRMVVGEKIAAVDLLKAMLLNSANDAATALGIHVAGSSENFVEMMNKRVKELGLRDSNFCTPSGLEIEGQEESCYSSAYDIARIASYSLRYKLIWDIMKIKETDIFSIDGKYSHHLKNTDKLIDQIDNCIGGKTGFTPLAGESLLLAVADPIDQHRIVAVVLNADNRWSSMKKLVDWTFDNYKWQ